LPKSQLVKKLHDKFTTEFSSQQYLKWTDFTDRNPEFKYYTNSALRAALKEVADAMALLLHEIDAFGLDKLVILKE